MGEVNNTSTDFGFGLQLPLPLKCLTVDTVSNSSKALLAARLWGLGQTEEMLKMESQFMSGSKHQPKAHYKRQFYSATLGTQ